MTMHTNTQHTPSVITVTFARAHTHAGRTYAPGDECSVRKLDAAWLVAQGVARFTCPPPLMPPPLPNRTAKPANTPGAAHEN